MRIHLLSDIHLEIDAPGRHFSPSVLDADVTVLAGDIHKGVHAIEWARQTFPGRVVMVAGNHEYWGGHLEFNVREMRKAAGGRVHFLEQDEAVINGVRFLGATCWTDYTSLGNAPLASWDAQLRMRDFERIRARGTFGDYRKLQPADIVAVNRQTRRWLEAKLSEPFAGKTVVVSHHAPLVSCVPAARLGRGDLLAAAYVNAWDDLMGPPVDAWFCGHTHEAYDAHHRGTRVVNNPVGYPGKSIACDPWKVIDL
jgi:predicted phosphodiesterase